MSKLSRSLVLLTVLGVAVLALTTMWNSAPAQPPATETPAKTGVPADQTYVGTKECSACHFKQYMLWKNTKHAKEAFEILPANYRADANCLPCHTTGYGQPSGYKDASTPNLLGVSCEACHGPGSKHAAVAKQYANAKLTPDQEKEVRGTIYLVRGNACLACHVDKAHKPHPKYEK